MRTNNHNTHGGCHVSCRLEYICKIFRLFGKPADEGMGGSRHTDSSRRSVRISGRHSLTVAGNTDHLDVDVSEHFDQSERSMDWSELVKAHNEDRDTSKKQAIAAGIVGAAGAGAALAKKGKDAACYDDDESSRDLESLLQDNTLSDSEEEASIDKDAETERAIRRNFAWVAFTTIFMMGFGKVASFASRLFQSGPEDDIAQDVAEVVADEVVSGATQSLQQSALQSSFYSSSSNSFYGGAGAGLAPGGTSGTGATGAGAGNTA